MLGASCSNIVDEIMPYKNNQDYYNQLKGIISHPKVTNHHFAVQIIHDSQNRDKAVVWTRPNHPLTFIDGAILRFTEDIVFVNREIERIEYSYHYVRENIFFRYDKDPAVIRTDHALCHLHAHQEEPRFPSHDTSLEEVFQFILAVYY
jgi:hypothetical protein